MPDQTPPVAASQFEVANAASGYPPTHALCASPRPTTACSSSSSLPRNTALQRPRYSYLRVKRNTNRSPSSRRDSGIRSMMCCSMNLALRRTNFQWTYKYCDRGRRQLQKLLKHQRSRKEQIRGISSPKWEIAYKNQPLHIHRDRVIHMSELRSLRFFHLLFVSMVAYFLSSNYWEKRSPSPRTSTASAVPRSSSYLQEMSFE